MTTNCDDRPKSSGTGCKTKSERYKPYADFSFEHKQSLSESSSKACAANLWKNKYCNGGGRKKMTDGYSSASGSSSVEQFLSLEHSVQNVVDAVALYDDPFTFHRYINVVDCYACRNLMLEPVTLPCGHTLCKKCAVVNVKVDTSTGWPLLNGNVEGSTSSLTTCSSSATCERCKHSYNPSNLKTNVVIARIIEKWWPNATKVALLRKEANALVESNLLEEAIIKFKASLKTDPQDYCSALELAEVLLKIGRAEDSLTYAENAIKNNPKIGKNYFVKSGALVSLGRYEDAVFSYLYCLRFGYNISEVKKEISKLFQKIVQQGQLCHRVSSHSLCNSISSKSRGDPKKSNDLSSENCIPEGFCAKMKSKLSQCQVKKEAERLRKLYDRCMQQVDIINGTRLCELNVRPVNWDNVDKQDLECPLCMRLLWEPVTTPCGHTYCRRCLDRSLDHQVLCPLCKTSLEEYLAERRSVITEALELTIQNFLPNEAEERKKSNEEELLAIKRAGTDSMQDVPLFICTIAFPTVRCPLHIFEPRYRLMTRQCIESGSRMFGMCPSLPHEENGTIYGTMLMIRDMQFLPDGRSILETVGRRRFKVLELSMRDGYHTGTIEYINDDPVEGGDQAIEELKSLQELVYGLSDVWFSTLPEETQLRINQHFGPKPSLPNDNLFSDANGPAWLWWLVAVLPLESSYQMNLLCTTSYRKRLELTHRLLDYCILNPF